MFTSVSQSIVKEPNQASKYRILEVKTEMFNEIQETEKYEIPKGDIIYRNKDSKKFTAVDLVNFQSGYIERFLKGTRRIHELDWVNIRDGYALSLQFLLSERKREPGKEKEIEHKIKDLSARFFF